MFFQSFSVSYDASHKCMFTQVSPKLCEEKRIHNCAKNRRITAKTVKIVLSCLCIDNILDYSFFNRKKKFILMKVNLMKYAKLAWKTETNTTLNRTVLNVSSKVK